MGVSFRRAFCQWQYHHTYQYDSYLFLLPSRKQNGYNPGQQGVLQYRSK